MTRPRVYGPFGLFRDRRLEILSVTRIYAWGFSLFALVFLMELVRFLVMGSAPIFHDRGLEVVRASIWSHTHALFGALPMVFGTLAVSAVALVIAGPVGILGAVCLSEFTPPRVRPWLKVWIELLAGVPSVVYGMLGVVHVRGAMEIWGLATPDSLLTAGIVLSAMVLPTILTLSDDALRAVGGGYRDQCRALGLDAGETVVFGVLPHAAGGIAAGLLLGLGRALGETIAVFLVVGRCDNQLPVMGEVLDFVRNPGQTLTSKLGSTEVFLAYADRLHWSAIVSLGLLLFLITGVLTFLGQTLMERRGAHG